MHTRYSMYFAYTHMSICAEMRIYMHVCLFVMDSHKFLYMKHCWSIKTYHFYGNEKGFKANFAYCLNVMNESIQALNESYHILSFRSLCKFTDKLLFLWHFLDLKLRKMWRKLKQELEVPILTHDFYVFTLGKICVSVCVCKLFAKCLFSIVTIDPHRKDDISCYIWHISFIQMVKCSLLDKSVARCLLSIRKTLLKKLYLWFCLAQIVQMVKYSFPDERVVYRSFYTHRQDLADVYCRKDLVAKSISPVIFDRNHSFKW